MSSEMKINRLLHLCMHPLSPKIYSIIIITTVQYVVVVVVAVVCWRIFLSVCGVDDDEIRAHTRQFYHFYGRFIDFDDWCIQTLLGFLAYRVYQKKKKKTERERESEKMRENTWNKNWKAFKKNLYYKKKWESLIKKKERERDT